MAVEKLKSLFEKDLRAAQRKWIGTTNFAPNDATIVEFTLGGSAAYAGFPAATTKVLDVFAQNVFFGKQALKLVQKVNTPKNWAKAGEKVLKRYARTKKIGRFSSLKTKTESKTGKRGTYINQPINSVDSEMKIAIWEPKSKANSRIQTIYDAFTKDIWIEWAKMYGVARIIGAQGGNLADPDQAFTRPASGAAGRRGATRRTTIIKTFRSAAKREHSPDTTTASQAVRDLETAIKGTTPGISYNGISVNTFDIIKHIKANTAIDWSLQTTKNSIGNYKATNVVKISLGKNPTNLDSDLRKLLGKAETAIRDELSVTVQKYLSNKDFEASTSRKNQIAADVTQDIMRPLTKAGLPDMRFKVNKKHKLQTKKRKEKLKKKETYKPQKSSFNVSTSAVLLKPQKSTEKKKETDAQNLSRLQAILNRNIGKKVQQDMGRPALRNQTGRFANSVQIERLAKTKAGITGDYTYQLSPYQTFENEGPRRWPTGYNPKPLITNSIRELALQYTTEKFTYLRRI